MAELNIKDTLKESIGTLSKSPITFLDAFFLTCISTTIQLSLQEKTTTIVPMILAILNVILLSSSIKYFYDKKAKNSNLEKINPLDLRKCIELYIDYFIFSVILALGFMIFIIPGLYLLIRLKFFAHAMIIDDECMIKAFKRSWKTTSNNWWRLLILGLITSTPKIAYTIIAGKITMTSLYETTPISLLLTTITFALMISIETTAYIKLNETERYQKEGNPYTIKSNATKKIFYITAAIAIIIISLYTTTDIFEKNYPNNKYNLEASGCQKTYPNETFKRDICLYNTAVMNIDSSVCDLIEDDERRQECKESIIKIKKKMDT